MGAPRNTRGRDRRRAKTADQSVLALDMRRNGASLRDIARELKLSGPQQASNLIEGALKAIPSAAVDSLRKEVDERSRVLLAELMPIALNRRVSRDDRLAVVDRIVRIDRELRQLHGLDAPTKTEVTGKGGGPLVTFDLSKLTDEQLDRLTEGDASALPGGDAGGAPEAGAGGEGTPPA